MQVLVHMGIDIVEIPDEQKSNIFCYMHKVRDVVNAKEPILNVN